MIARPLIATHVDFTHLTKQSMTLQFNTLSLVVAAFASAFPLLAHAEHRSVDARTLDVAGVKTGMDYEQAVSALMAHFKISRKQIKPEPSPGVNLVTQTRLPQYVTYENNGVKIAVYFEPRVPVDKTRPQAVSLITYEVPWSSQNSAAMADMASSKYGEQSNFPNKLPMHWCAEPHNNPGMGCPIDGALLELSKVRLKLIDPAWQNARIKFVQDSQARKPSF